MPTPFCNGRFQNVFSDRNAAVQAEAWGIFPPEETDNIISVGLLAMKEWWAASLLIILFAKAAIMKYYRVPYKT